MSNESTYIVIEYDHSYPSVYVFSTEAKAQRFVDGRNNGRPNKNYDIEKLIVDCEDMEHNEVTGHLHVTTHQDGHVVKIEHVGSYRLLCREDEPKLHDLQSARDTKEMLQGSKYFGDLNGRTIVSFYWMSRIDAFQSEGDKFYSRVKKQCEDWNDLYYRSLSGNVARPAEIGRA